MNKVLVSLLLLTLIGCSKDDDINPSSPYIGKWQVVDITHIFPIPGFPSNPKITVSNSDYVCIGSYDIKQTLSNGDMVLTQDTSKFPISRRFIKNVTVWEFEKGLPYRDNGVIVGYSYGTRVYENGKPIIPFNSNLFLVDFRYNGNFIVNHNNENTIFEYNLNNNIITLVIKYSVKIGINKFIETKTIIHFRRI